MKYFKIEIEKKRFPLFYTQINIKEYARESHFEISFSNEMFVNKRAIQYAFDVLRKDEKKVETFTEERKIYISEEEDFSKKLKKCYSHIGKCVLSARSLRNPLTKKIYTDSCE